MTSKQMLENIAKHFIRHGLFKVGTTLQEHSIRMSETVAAEVVSDIRNIVTEEPKP